MIRHFILLASILVTGHALSAPQTPPPAPASASPVRLLVTLTDKAGKPISTAKASDFKIFEEGKLQTITTFGDATSLPLSVVIAVDTSGSSTDTEVTDILNKTLDVLESVLRTGRDRVALVTFSSSGRLVQQFTDDIRSLRTTLSRGLDQPYGGTRLYDGLSNVSTLLAATGGRKNIIVISDGEDTESQTSREEMMKRIVQDDVSIVSIFATHLGRSSLFDRPRAGMQILERMAEDTGGLFFDFKELKRLDSLRDALMSQYTLEFQSNRSVAGGKYRKIKIEASNKDYRIRYRPGYYP